MTEPERRSTISSDDELMAELAAAVGEAAAVSERRRTAARAAFTWRTVDAELAELLHDSALDAGAAVRSGSDGPRMLSFRRAAVTLEVEIDGESVLGEVLDGSDGSTPRPPPSPCSAPTPTTGRSRRTPRASSASPRSGRGRCGSWWPGPGWTLTTPWATI